MNRSVNLEQLTIRNFKSYGDKVTTINFDKSGTILITGVDLDKTAEGTVANGTGKTTILDAISFAIYDKPIVETIRTKDCLINNINKKNMHVTLVFSKNGERYKISRHRKLKGKGAGGVELFIQQEGEWHNISQTSRGTNDTIVDIIGLPHELFKQIVLFSATTSPFLSLPRTHTTQPSQKSMVEFLFGFDILTRKAEELKTMRGDVRNDLNLAKREAEFKEREISSHKSMVEGIIRRYEDWERLNKQNIATLESQYENSSKIDVTHELEILKAIKELTEQRNQLPITELRNNKRTLEREINRLNSELSSIESGNCPYCKQELGLGEHDHKEKIEKELVSLSSELETASKDYDNQIIIEEEISNNISTLRGASSGVSESQLLNLKSELDIMAHSLETLKEEVNPFISQLEDIEEAEVEAVDYSKIEDMEDKLKHFEILIKLLSNNDSFIRKNILERSLPFLNTQLNTYLQEMGLEFNVYFTDSLEAKVTRFGREMEHGNVSNGQKARINIALSFAFRDVLQKLSVPFNICFLDEVMDFGLDPVGVRNASRLIKKKAKEDGIAYYIITHRDEASNLFDEIMTIEMKNGFSNLMK